MCKERGTTAGGGEIAIYLADEKRREKNGRRKVNRTKNDNLLAKIVVSFGGELGIRTLGPFRDTAFRVLCSSGLFMIFHGHYRQFRLIPQTRVPQGFADMTT